MQILNRKVHLIDTPGFDDSERTDGETLQELTYWLAAAYERKIQLSGLVYLHRITDTRLQGSASQGLAIFKKMCGEENYHGIVIATTRWDEIAPEQMASASKRQQDLRERAWGDIFKGGGYIVALSAARIDAMNIIRHIVCKNYRLTLAFQRQIVDEERPIYETDAGKVIFDTLEDYEEQFQGTLNHSGATMGDSITACHTAGAREANEAMGNVTNNMRLLQEDLERMKKRVRDVRAEWDIKLQEDAAALVEASKANAERLKRKEAELGFLRRNRSIPTRSELCLKEEVQMLENERGEIAVKKTHKLHERRTTAIGIVGASLALAQLAAACACIVM